MLRTPVLFLVFNRPTFTRMVFEQIKKVKPCYLYIAADGPRKSKSEDERLVNEVRDNILQNIDWDCEIKTLFRSENLGCGKAVSEAINWFFENVEEGIILEDDCVPDSSFFRYCEELLERYRTDNRVFSISGSNLLGRPWNASQQSYFWALPGIWGWATWRRSWLFYDFEMKRFEEKESENQIRKGLVTEGWFLYYYPMMSSTYHKTIDTWDVQWLFAALVNGGLTANPCINLVKNIGFGRSSTHTDSPNNPIAKLLTSTLRFPLKHPSDFSLDISFIKLMYLHIFSIRTPRDRIFRLSLYLNHKMFRHFFRRR